MIQNRGPKNQKKEEEEEVTIPVLRKLFYSGLVCDEIEENGPSFCRVSIQWLQTSTKHHLSNSV